MLEKLQIRTCKVENGSITPEDCNTFKAMINPASFKHSHCIAYMKDENMGALPNVGDFHAYSPESVSFDLWFDGTGVVNENLNAVFDVNVINTAKQVLSKENKDKPPLVKERIDQLKKVIYDYDGELHRPQVVEIKWGTFTFIGCLTSLDIDYKMFTSEGKPLRARVSLAFKSYMTSEVEGATAQNSSPDLTHVVEIKAGDTLPLLCQRIYEDGSYCPDVARANNLTGFRFLQPGTRLIFPPLR